MKIRIYQINMSRDKDGVAFENLDQLEMFYDAREIHDSSIYDKVFEGEVKCGNLEEVYEKFNLDHPEGYKGRSLSVSDVVEIVNSPEIVGVVKIGGDGERTFTDLLEYTAFQDMLRDQGRDFEAFDYIGLHKHLIEPGFYFCDSIGFEKVKFDPQAAKENKDTIRVVLLEPGKEAKVTRIEHTLEDMQAIVGGDIEAFYPFEEEVCIVCNEEGKINGFPLNRAVFAEPTEKEMSYGEMVARFRVAERIGKHLDGYIVFTEDSFAESYPEEARTYCVSSNNKAFKPNMGGYSIYGSALDGSDPMVRLERYMAKEKGGEGGWKIERCYMKEESREILDIIAGTCFICDCSGEDFGSLSEEQAARYASQFRLPENFVKMGSEIRAIPFEPAKDDLER